jgi:hypothetical protein
MSDAHSIITSDADKFSSLLSTVLWRPTNLTTLAAANISGDAIKHTAFLESLVFLMCNTYFEGQGLLPGDLSVIWGYLGILGAALLLVNLPTVKSMSSAVELNTTCQAAYKYFHSGDSVLPACSLHTVCVLW